MMELFLMAGINLVLYRTWKIVHVCNIVVHLQRMQIRAYYGELCTQEKNS